MAAIRSPFLQRAAAPQGNPVQAASGMQNQFQQRLANALAQRQQPMQQPVRPIMNQQQQAFANALRSMR
jgi:hypothetical protein